MNIIIINAKVIICNSLFYGSNDEQIEQILRKYRIKLSYDNGVSTVRLMRQLMEKFLFYHELGHLIQAWNPALGTSKKEEQNNKTNLVFDVTDHIAEIDADMFAYNRIATHIIRITDQGSETQKDTENLCSVLITSYLLYRCLLLKKDTLNFYTNEYDHPHLLIRMFGSISGICSAINENTDFEIELKRIIDLSLTLMDELCMIHPEILMRSDFTQMSYQNSYEIKKYYEELVSLSLKYTGTTYAKRNRYLRTLGN